eukprot:TRINITY_DN4365_c0_g1_i2.p1 TRINITY_DN4365_c0_g1~~TRINITY_DN4365_c0_g1_i2.p1  ORF type:complete len:170 (-),score=39.92 TRINITY_DN4365_c0_g1_i2:169-678(-)
MQTRQPHLVGLQEVLHNQLEDLKMLFPDYQFFGKARDDGQTCGEYSPILVDSRRFHVLRSGTFWLSPTPHVPSRGWDAACLRICTWVHMNDLWSTNPEKVVAFYNTHLDHVSEVARLKGEFLSIWFSVFCFFFFFFFFFSPFGELFTTYFSFTGFVCTKAEMKGKGFFF